MDAQLAAILRIAPLARAGSASVSNARPRGPLAQLIRVPRLSHDSDPYLASLPPSNPGRFTKRHESGQTNGKIEHFHHTLADGWAYARHYTSETQRRQALPAWLHLYNHHRPHTACHNQPPATRVPTHVTNVMTSYT